MSVENAIPSVDETSARGVDFTDPNSPLAPYYFQTSHVVAALFILGVFFFFGLLVPLWHSDFWAHLKFGQWMVTHGELPKTEPFSPYSDSSAPYHHFQWLTQVVYYGLFKAGGSLAKGDVLQQLAGGVDMVRGFHGLVVALRFLFLMLAFWRFGKSLPLAVLGAGLVLLLTIAPSAIQRPQALGELCFAVLLFCLARPTLSLKAVVGIPLLMGLWANLHGSFLMGLQLIPIFALGRALELAWDHSWKKIFRDPQILRLTAVFLLSMGAVVLGNPHGAAIFRNAFHLAHHPNIGTMEEWAALDFSKPIGGHWSYLAILAFLLISQAVSPASLTPTHILLLLGFGIVPLFHQRMMTWWVLTFGVLLMPLWKATLDAYAGGIRLPESTPSFRKTLFVIAISLVALVWSGPFQLLLGKPPQPLATSLSSATPLDFALRLSQQKPAPIFASETIADFFLYTIPKHSPLVYSHVTVFPEEHWKDHMTVLFGKPGWSEILDRHGISLVVFESESHKDFAKILRQSPDWQVILDENETSPKKDPRGWLIAAVRKNKE